MGFYRVTVSVFSKPEDEPARIEEALRSLFPFSLEDQKIVLKRTKAIGFNEREIIVFEVTLDKRSHIRKFSDQFFGSLTEDQRGLLVRQLESRLDEHLHFFIRLDKPRLLSGKRFITDSGDCFHCKFSVEVFPRSRENALEDLRSLLGGGADA